MRYVGSLDSGSPNVSIARFYDASKDPGAYVLWAPTSVGTVTSGYVLNVDSRLTAATLVTLADKTVAGTESALTPSAGKLTLS